MFLKDQRLNSLGILCHRISLFFDFLIVFKNVKINSIEIYDDNNILIKGENFNNYSNVYINGKYIEKISIDNNTLSIPLNYCKKGDKIQIRQDSTTDSTIFSYSNELTFK